METGAYAHGHGAKVVHYGIGTLPDLQEQSNSRLDRRYSSTRLVQIELAAARLVFRRAATKTTAGQTRPCDKTQRQPSSYLVLLLLRSVLTILQLCIDPFSVTLVSPPHSTRT